MSADNRTVATDALETLGTIIDETAARDAIHLGVEPAIAAHRLQAGYHVGFDELGHASAHADTCVGIVDPFLQAPVFKGERFWLVVYPRQITSLRHVWEHPAFPGASVDPTQVSAKPIASEQWMRAWASKHMSDDYYGDGGRLSDDAAYAHAIDAGHNNSVGPYEDARDHIDSEWWGHWEAITGRRGDRDSHFSCSC